MDFKDIIKQLAGNIEDLKPNMPTEEATKNALVMPFIQALGYNVFNPKEVLPEMTCDIVGKKGERIDYAILQDGNPIILIECKHWQQPLDLHETQLTRYYTVSKAKFGILTNGIIYRFYTDLKETNIMDEKPFMEINMLDLKDNQLEELKKFHKSYFDLDTILNTASELKYMNELKTIITNEFNSPTSEFVKYFGRQVYDGVFTQKITDQFTALVKKSINSYMNDMIGGRLKAAIKENEEKEAQNIEENTPAPEVEDNRINTTEEEIQGYHIVQAILSNTIDNIDRITYRDTQSYFTVLIDDNRNNLICRLYVESETCKHIDWFDENKQKVRNDIEKVSDIYKYSQDLINICKRILNNMQGSK